MIFISTSHADTECHPLSGRGVGRSTGPNLENKNKKRKPSRKFSFLLFLTPKLFTICKFRMICVALILVMNYNTQVAFKRGLT